ncbi:MAG: hypothetical protein DLM57_09445 [Pseudonocardiales bacterium]|nr:MAG: hypothetical protein DLM57_09445 [Pseudonocardiales bacterium]
MTQFTVDVTQLRQHASDVRRVAASVGQAGDAANQVGIGGLDIYGVLCSGLIVPSLHAFFGDAVDLVNKTAGLADAYADGLKANSDVYEEVDNHTRDTLNTLKSDTF